VILRNSRREQRTRAVAEFTTGPFTTDIREHELIEAIEIPKPSPQFRCGYFKFCRKAGDFPEASAFVAFDTGRQRARAYLGALDGPPMAFPDLAREALASARTETLPLEAIAPAVKRALSHIDDVRLAMYVGVMQRALERAIL
jgi:carbon-monoxide dehydrogenase medium subunit